MNLMRYVFFSFHYERDIFRVNTIRNIPEIISCAAAGFKDASLWEEAQKKSDLVIKRLINRGLSNTTVTVICLGRFTAGREYINYEIEQSLKRGNGLVGIQIHHIKNIDETIDQPGKIPPQIDLNGYKSYKYTTVQNLAKHIEEAYRISCRKKLLPGLRRKSEPKKLLLGLLKKPAPKKLPLGLRKETTQKKLLPFLRRKPQN